MPGNDDTIFTSNTVSLRDSLIVVISALIVRVVNLIFISIEPIFRCPVVDARWHHLWAELVSSGSITAYAPYFRAPLYPWTLGLLYRVISPDILAGSLFSVILSCLGAFLLYRIASERLPGGWALATGLIWVFWGTDIFYSSTLLITTLFTVLLLLSFYYLKRGRGYIGWLILGFACVTRPSALVLLPVAFMISRPGWRGAVLAAVPVMLVWMVNLSTGDPGNVIASQGGINLWLGNGPGADGYTAFAPNTDREMDSHLPYTDNVQAASRHELPENWSGSRISSWWIGRTVRYIFDNPGRSLLLTGRKLLYLISPVEIPSNYDVYYFRRYSPVLSILLVPGPAAFPFLLLWALLPGAIAAGRLTRKELTLLIWTALLLACVLVFFVTARFRLPAVPFLLLFLVCRISRNPRRALFLSPVGITVGIVLALLTGGTVRTGGVNMPFFDGVAHAEAGNIEEAENLFLEALSRASSRTDRIDMNRSDAMFNLGVIAARTGRLDEAGSWWRAVLEYNPAFTPALEALSTLNGLD